MPSNETPTASIAAGTERKRKDLRAELNTIEKQIYELESSYLEDTRDFGNIFSGWGCYLSAERIKKRKTIGNEERLFSLSSVTSPASRKENAKKTATTNASSSRKKSTTENETQETDATNNE